MLSIRAFVEPKFVYNLRLRHLRSVLGVNVDVYLGPLEEALSAKSLKKFLIIYAPFPKTFVVPFLSLPFLMFWLETLRYSHWGLIPLVLVFFNVWLSGSRLVNWLTMPVNEYIPRIDTKNGSQLAPYRAYENRQRLLSVLAKDWYFDGPYANPAGELVAFYKLLLEDDSKPPSHLLHNDLNFQELARQKYQLSSEDFDTLVTLAKISPYAPLSDTFELFKAVSV